MTLTSPPSEPNQLASDTSKRPRPAVTVALVLVCVPFFVWAAVSLVGWDHGRYSAALVALTQYLVPLGVVLAAVVLISRRWTLGVALVLVTASAAVLILPRVIPNETPVAGGAPLRVMSSNLYFGQADPQHVVELARNNQVDVIAFQELTPELAAALDRAGLRELLPYRAYDTRPGRGTAEGSGIASRYPLMAGHTMPTMTFHHPAAIVDIPGPRKVEIVGVHPVTPVSDNPTWQRELGLLPHPAEAGHPPRILVGDFNATLDHSPLQAVLKRGYADAAERTGTGLTSTWPESGPLSAPPVTIDHVLVSGGITARELQTFPVRGTDHRALVAELTVSER